MERDLLISLVSAAQRGKSDAMDKLFTTFYNDVYYFALKTIKDSDTACDITQETFLEIINTIGSLKEPAAFVIWMKQITYHRCTRYFKKKKDVLVEEDEDGNTIFDTLVDESEDSIPEEVYEKEDFRNTILGIINELTEEQRSAVMMYYFDELSVGQIAEIQGVSDGTVKSRLNYARKAIKKSVEDYEEKHNIKLHSFSFLPLLMLFFGKEIMPAAKVAEIGTVVSGAASTAAGTVALASQGVGGIAAAASVQTTAAVTGAGIAAKIAAIPIVTKIIAAISAVALTVGGVTVISNVASDTDSTVDSTTYDTTDITIDNTTEVPSDETIDIITDSTTEVPTDETTDDTTDSTSETPVDETTNDIVDNPHDCVDMNDDCVCDICPEPVHHPSSPGHEARCIVCRRLLEFRDEDDDFRCDECGQYLCGDIHYSGHLDDNLDDICDWCSHKHKDSDYDHVCDACHTIMENVDHKDLDGDCYCDDCPAMIHHSNGIGHDDFCILCGFHFGFFDADGDSCCDECGQLPCGEYHRDVHLDSDLNNICELCGVEYSF
ncbi:MAG: sigma-70 family RNA polymerase sigma factor [Clostridia bacterium]|nr:sigma-70 family RNA polymerase sigma factor [Clostridia bacterium]